jgi:hypothetical protein
MPNPESDESTGSESVGSENMAACLDDPDTLKFSPDELEKAGLLILTEGNSKAHIAVGAKLIKLGTIYPVSEDANYDISLNDTTSIRLANGACVRTTAETNEKSNVRFVELPVEFEETLIHDTYTQMKRREPVQKLLAATETDNRNKFTEEDHQLFGNGFVYSTKLYAVKKLHKAKADAKKLTAKAAKAKSPPPNPSNSDDDAIDGENEDDDDGEADETIEDEIKHVDVHTDDEEDRVLTPQSHPTHTSIAPKPKKKTKPAPPRDSDMEDGDCDYVDSPRKKKPSQKAKPTMPRKKLIMPKPPKRSDTPHKSIASTKPATKRKHVTEPTITNEVKKPKKSLSFSASTVTVTFSVNEASMPEFMSFLSNHSNK